jgi:hypothetical protein
MSVVSVGVRVALIVVVVMSGDAFLCGAAFRMVRLPFYWRVPTVISMWRGGL